MYCLEVGMAVNVSLIFDVEEHRDSDDRIHEVQQTQQPTNVAQSRERAHGRAEQPTHLLGPFGIADDVRHFQHDTQQPHHCGDAPIEFERVLQDGTCVSTCISHLSKLMPKHMSK